MTGTASNCFHRSADADERPSSEDVAAGTEPDALGAVPERSDRRAAWSGVCLLHGTSLSWIPRHAVDEDRIFDPERFPAVTSLSMRWDGVNSLGGSVHVNFGGSGCVGASTPEDRRDARGSRCPARPQTSELPGDTAPGVGVPD